MRRQIFKHMNWGTKVVIGMALFMAFILAMATKMVIDGGDDDLVEKDYYEKGLAYDRVYDLKTMAITDSVVPDFKVGEEGLVISFKSPSAYKLVCKRSSDSSLDQVFEEKINEVVSFVVPKGKLKKGPWNLIIEFSSNGKEYLVEREMTMP